VKKSNPSIKKHFRAMTAHTTEISLGVSPGVRLLAMGAFFFSLGGLFIKLVGQSIPFMEIVFVRAAVGLLFCLVGLRSTGTSILGHHKKLLFLRGFVGFLAMSCVFYSLVRLPLADATVLFYMNPIFAAFLSVCFLGERVSLLYGACVLASLTGVVCIVKPTILFAEASGLPPIGVGVMLLGAWFAGCTIVIIRKLGQGEHSLVVVLYLCLVTSVFSFILAIPGWVWPTLVQGTLLVGVGLVTSVGQIFMTRGIKLEPAAKASAVMYLQIIFVALWGAIAFGEYPDLWGACGAILILGSTFALNGSQNIPGQRFLKSFFPVVSGQNLLASSHSDENSPEQ
jgi:drug/metabolite transporter (DMT)-like permease